MPFLFAPSGDRLVSGPQANPGAGRGHSLFFWAPGDQWGHLAPPVGALGVVVQSTSPPAPLPPVTWLQGCTL